MNNNDTAFCTIVTKSYLAYARALAVTLAKHNPENRLFVLLADRIDGYFDPKAEPFDLITIEELSDQEDIHKMCFYYNAIEMCFVLRAWLHEYMFEKTNYSKWIYLDADIAVYHSFKKISEQLNSISILLSPHLISITPPPSIDVRAVRKLESYFVRNGGIFQGGFLALRRTDECYKFVKWFKDHLLLYGFNDRPLHSGDQFWMTYIPSYFHQVSVLRNPGANLAYWNLYERTIEQSRSGEILVNGEPLVFFHYAGFDMGKPERLTKYSLNRGLMIIPRQIIKLAFSYHRLLIECGYEYTKAYPYAFATFENGQTINPVMRRLYYEFILHNKPFDGSPFKQYSYFKRRLRLTIIRRFLGELGRNVISRIRRYINPDYDFDVP